MRESLMTAKKAKNLTRSRQKKPAAPSNNPSPLVPLPQGESKIGGKGNRTGFYEKVLKEAEAMDFETAAGANGLDDEITLLRVKIKALVEKDPDNIKLIMAATGMLAKLIKTRYSISKREEKSLGESIKNIIKDIGVPLGVAAINKKL
jgi:hypothetical protein